MAYHSSRILGVQEVLEGSKEVELLREFPLLAVSTLTIWF